MPSPDLLARLGELSDLGHAGHLMGWDQQVVMPPEGMSARGHALGTIQRLAHDRLVAPELVPLLSQIAREPVPAALTGHVAIAGQREVRLEIVAAMGYGPASWRVDDAVPPFASSPSFNDVRITSHFDDHSLPGVFALMDETGHGLYEHGVDRSLARTTLDSGVSLGVHESQSRLWENLVGRSPEFWEHWLPRLRERFPLTLREVTVDAFVRAINVVRPTLIRYEADEVTYSLHVIL